ncbi:hypothetical protein Dsin_012265 [Dipteronia sinensis]|uniref:Uncharacterized protein n=1 Tax=Dipteronia sinensis TaxID=43782 RepID=A0AAE0AIK2_9ROSI|nr:hypothetical protein Dsin_012265 [Dipteronia sinensis]
MVLPCSLATKGKARGSDFIRDGRWILDDRFRSRFPDLCFLIGRIVISLVTDYLEWPHSRDGSVSCKAAYFRMFLDIAQWIFEGKSVDFRVALSLVWHSIYDVNHLGIGCMHNCVDDLLILHWFGLSYRPGKAPVIKSAVWSPPAPGWIKVNMNGAALGYLACSSSLAALPSSDLAYGVSSFSYILGSLHGGVGGCCDGFMGGAGSGGGDMQSTGAGAMHVIIYNGNAAINTVLYEDEGPTVLHV